LIFNYTNCIIGIKTNFELCNLRLFWIKLGLLLITAVNLCGIVVLGQKGHTRLFYNLSNHQGTINQHHIVFMCIIFKKLYHYLQYF